MPTLPGLTDDPGAGGGTTSIYVDHEGNRVREYVSLAGTVESCATLLAGTMTLSAFVHTHVPTAVDGEGLLLPSAPAVAQSEPGDPGHEVQLTRIDQAQ